MGRFILTSIFILLHCQLNASDPSWPQFRGPNGDGIANEADVPTTFNKSTNLDWRTVIPGKGWSSPVVAGNSIWLTSAHEVKPSEEERLRLLEESGVSEKKLKTKQIANNIQLLVVEVNRTTGELIQQFELAKVDKPDSIHNLNSYASPTPCIENNFLYAHFGTYGTYCFDTKNKSIVWQNKQTLEHGVGPGSSPITHNDLLIMIFDGVDQQYVTALNKHTGEQVWKTTRPEMRSESGDKQKAYSTPIIVPTKNGGNQVVCLGAQWIVSYDPATGAENWKTDHGSGFSVVPRPIYSEKQQLIYFSTGFPKPELWAINTAGELKWKVTKRIPAKPSPILIGDEVYIITDAGIVTCLNAADGEAHWSERLTGNFSASPLLAGNNLYFCSHEGLITIFTPAKTAKQIAENNIEEQIMASPIAIENQLIIRSSEALYSFKETK